MNVFISDLPAYQPVTALAEVNLNDGSQIVVPVFEDTEDTFEIVPQGSSKGKDLLVHQCAEGEFELTRRQPGTEGKATYWRCVMRPRNTGAAPDP
jgi:hypothetical protein